MSMERKGLTPVIAIVLLLFITVGAVGVVYTQFNDVIAGGQQSTQQTLDALTSSIDVVLGSEACNVINTGDSAVSVSGGVAIAANGSTSGLGSDSIGSGKSVSCNLGFVPESVEIQVNGTQIASAG